MGDVFKVCSTCKKPIVFEAAYYRCSVSTCNRKRTALYFCSVPCWDAHVPGAGHRDAWAEEEVAPAKDEFEAAEAKPEVRASGSSSARRVVTTPRSNADRTPLAHEASGGDVLVVVSKLKKHIKEQSGMNTSSGVLTVLSDHLRELADDAVREAASHDRRTVLDRDFSAVLKRRQDAARRGAGQA